MDEAGAVFTAVQEDATAFCVDWPVFDADGSRGTDSGTVFVLDVTGARICDAPLTAPHNRAADEALNRIGWTRCGAWHRDSFGRRAASVIAVGAAPPALPTWESPAVRIRSLADEAPLHLA